MEILNKGDYQVSDLERESQLENLRKEVAHLITNMCVNKNNLGSIPLSLVIKAMD